MTTYASLFDSDFDAMFEGGKLDSLYGDFEESFAEGFVDDFLDEEIDEDFEDDLEDEDNSDLADIASNDTVGLYLKEMARVPLLNNEEEVAIACRIEAGREAQKKLTDRKSVV